MLKCVLLLCTIVKAVALWWRQMRQWGCMESLSLFPQRPQNNWSPGIHQNHLCGLLLHPCMMWSGSFDASLWFFLQSLRTRRSLMWGIASWHARRKSVYRCNPGLSLSLNFGQLFNFSIFHSFNTQAEWKHILSDRENNVALPTLAISCRLFDPCRLSSSGVPQWCSPWCCYLSQRPSAS